jgi:hypothetical protein
MPPKITLIIRQKTRKNTTHDGKNIALRAKKPKSDWKFVFLRSHKRKMFFSETVFLLSLISKHEMRRVGLVMTDGSLLTIRQQQSHAQILKKMEINERVFEVFVNN